MTRDTILTVSALILLAFPATAAAHYWQPFVNFLPEYGSRFASSWTDACAAQVATDHSQSAWCESILDCVLENSGEALKANMAGAAILLGLAPTILGNLAPAIEDLAFLSSQRPLLGLLLAVGTPSLSAANPFGVENPIDPVLKRLESARGVFAGLARRHNDSKAILVNIAQYLLAAACAANVISLSYDLMERTVVTWSCPNWGWVIGWSFIPTVLYLAAAVLFRLTVRTTRFRPSGTRAVLDSKAGSASTSAGGAGASSPPPPSVSPDSKPTLSYSENIELRSGVGGQVGGKGYSPVQDERTAYDPYAEAEVVDDRSRLRREGSGAPGRGRGGPLAFLWRHEFQPCAQRRLPRFLVSRSWRAQLLRWAIPLGCYVQYVMGTAILGSLFPVIVRDAFPVLVRYSVSGGVAHLLASWELRSLAERNSEEERGGVRWEWVQEERKKGVGADDDDGDGDDDDDHM